MRVRQLVLTVAGLVIGFLVGRYIVAPVKLVVKTPNPANRTVWISKARQPQKGCEVNFPVASLKENADQIEWASTDSEYWVKFKPLGEPSPGYDPEDPLQPPPNKDTVYVPKNSSGITSGLFMVKFDHQPVPGGPPNGPLKYGDPNYFMYDIYNHDPNDPTTGTAPPCKSAIIEHDTGVIVKR